MTVHDLSNPIKPWENEIWTSEPLFRGETVVCIASGPSLTQEICDRIRDARDAGRCKAIVVNSSCMLAPWADVLYFTDSGWYDARKELVARWPGLVVSMSRQAKRELDTPELVAARGGHRILRVKGAGDPSWPPRLPGMPKRLGFPPVGSPEIHQGRNSGNTAVSLAIGMGAARVLLVGYDCQLVNGREHHHTEYSGPRDLTIYDLEFQKAFNGWNEAALNSGVTIVNCTHGSAITEFPFADLDEALACSAR
jgi:hypothetical protein